MSELSFPEETEILVNLQSLFAGHDCFASKELITLDSEEHFPTEATQLLDEWGLPAYYVPVAFGGKLEDYGTSFKLIRALSSIDLTLAISHASTFLGAVCIWIAGNTDQANYVANLILNSNRISLGLTEQAHGSDLLANEVQAQRAADGYILNGEKWLINNAGRGDALCIFARTKPDGGARGFSIFFIEKAKLEPNSYATLPKILTHGLRGMNLSGITFTISKLPETCLVGQEGHGLEIALKALQITRTLCSSLALGAADHILKLLAELDLLPPNVLVSAVGDILLADASAWAATRVIQGLSQELGLISSIIKVAVPLTVERLFISLEPYTGVNSMIFEGKDSGQFQKLYRDHRIVSLFDGNTLVNLQAVVMHLKLLSKLWRLQSEQNLESLFSVNCKLSILEPKLLSVGPKPKDSVMQGFQTAKRDLQTHSNLKPLIEQFEMCLSNLEEEVNQLSFTLHEIPARVFELAEQYSYLWMGVACMQVYRHNYAYQSGQWWQNAAWLELALANLMQKFGGNLEVSEPSKEFCQLSIATCLNKQTSITVFTSESSL